MRNATGRSRPRPTRAVGAAWFEWDAGELPVRPVVAYGLKRWLAYLVVSLALGGLAIAAPDTVAAAGAKKESPRQLLVGSEVDYPPFALGEAGGVADGFTVDLWKAVARKAGLDYRIVVAPFHQILAAFKNDEIDVMINLAQSAERMQFADFSLPHINVQGAFFARKGDDRIRSTADLSRMSIIVINADFFHRVAESMDLTNLVPVDTVGEAMKLLASGKHDAVLVARLVGLQTLRDEGVRSIVPVLTLPEPRQKFAFAVYKGETELLAKINEALAEIKVSGEYDAIYEKWFGLIDPRRPTLAQMATYIVPAVAVIALIGFAYLRERWLAQRLAQSTSSLRAMMDNFPYPLWLKDSGGRFVAVNEPLARSCGQPGAATLVGKTDFDIWPRELAQAYRSDDLDVAVSKHRKLAARPIDDNGATRWLESFNTPVVDGAGKLLGTTGFTRDITESKLAEELLVGQCDVLELIARETPLEATFDRLNRLLEAQMPGALCAVCMMDEDGLTLQTVSAPSLAGEYVRAVDRVPVGPCAGSCGTAAYRHEPVIVSDLATDPLWADFRDLALSHDLRACWSTPILDSHHQVVGTFAVYFRAPRLPDERYRHLIEVATQTAAIAIERERAERSLREHQAMLEKAEEVSRMGSWDWNLRTNVVKWSSETYRVFGVDPSVSKGSLIEVVANTAHPDDRARLKTFFRHATATPGSHEIEYRLIVRDGSVRIIEVEGQLIGDAEGRPARFVGTVHDITERRAAEDSLKELAFRLEEAQRLAHIGSWEWNIALNVLWWSDEIYRIFGISKSGFGANVEAFWACVHPDDVAAVKASERRAFSGLGHNIEHRIVLPDRSIRWVHELGEVDFGADGKPVRMRGTVQDITQRKSAEEALAERQALLRCLLDSIDDIIFFKDKEGRYLGCNPATEAVLGRPESEWIGKTDLDLFPADIASDFQYRDREMMAAGSARRNEEWITYPDGRRILLEMLKTPYRGPNGEFLGVIGVGRDITDRNKAEADLKANKEALERAVSMLDATIESTADGILVVGRDRKASQFNKRFLDLWRIPAALAAERDDAKLLAFVREQLEDPDGFGTLVQQLYDDPERESYDTIAFRDGRVFERYSRPQRVDREIVGRVWSFRDVTLRVNAEMEIRRLNEALEERVRQRTAELEASNMELESFSYSVSHDLRAPLRGIDGWSHALLEDYGTQLDDQAHTYLHRVRVETKRMSTLIDDLLRLARVTRSEMRRVDVNLSRLALERTQALRRMEPDRQVDFAIAPDLVAKGDPGLLGIVIQNLLENAWKFTRQSPAPRIEFGVQMIDEKPTYFVRDNGAGFDMAYADRLFGAFQRLHRASEYPGTGIGLATVLRIVRRHGGRVWAEGAVGKGATFHFSLDWQA